MSHNLPSSVTQAQLPDPPRTRSTQQRLSSLLKFALIVPPIVLVLGWLAVPLYGLRLLEVYWLMIGLSPALGLLTLAILAFQFAFVAEEPEPLNVSRGRLVRLAVLAIIAPAWLLVLYFAVAVFHR